MASRKKSTRSASPDYDAARAIGESAQKIWLAGLGAFERARAEGPRMFDTLVSRGRGLGGKAREAADQALKNLRDGAAGASGRFDKLEQVFEARVSKSLDRLGIMTRREVNDLTRQVRNLTQDVRKLIAKQARAPKGAARKGKAKRSTRKSTRGSRARRA